MPTHSIAASVQQRLRLRDLHLYNLPFSPLQERQRSERAIPVRDVKRPRRNYQEKREAREM